MKPTKKNLEDFCIKANPHSDEGKGMLLDLVASFELDAAKIRSHLAEINAPRPDELSSNKAMFPMRRHKKREYNIFEVEMGYVGIVFDQYRRPYYQTDRCAYIGQAIERSKRIAELLAKGQCVPFGFKLDKGKAIREKEEQAQAGAAKTRRKSA